MYLFYCWAVRLDSLHGSPLTEIVAASGRSLVAESVRSLVLVSAAVVATMSGSGSHNNSYSDD